MTSQLIYDVTVDDGPVQVTWDVSLVNNDPATQNRLEGQVAFYHSLTLPLLRGASNVSALSSEGQPLSVSLDTSHKGPAEAATVAFDRRLFYQDTYGLTVSYELSNVRERSILVTPNYIFLPLIAGGDEATVSVKTPDEPPWTVEVAPVDCSGDVQKLACTGATTYLAATLEVSRPDAMSSATFNVQLAEKDVPISLTYFQGEEAFAQHLQDLASAALPIMEDVYGVLYGGPEVKIAQGGRQAVLGYEGVTSCDSARCSIVISPIADDLTALHEFAHLWSGMYGKRWLSEGFAQLVAEGTAARLPAGLVQGQPPARDPPALELQLDDWGEVTSIIGAEESELQTESAGYDRSLRFLALLQSETGLRALQQANRLIAQSGPPADSRRFMDALEDAGGNNRDDLFKLWVFPESLYPTLDDRRDARDRLALLLAGIEGTGLSSRVPDAIRRDVLAWRFREALSALDNAEAGLESYDDLLPRLETLKANAQTAGLSLGTAIDDRLLDWNFDEAGQALASAEDALNAYKTARQKVDSPRNLWKRFGLMGSDPEGALSEAAAAFNRSDYERAAQQSAHASGMIDDASDRAFQRLLIVAGILGMLSLAIGVAFWVSRLRHRALA